MPKKLTKKEQFNLFKLRLKQDPTFLAKLGIKKTAKGFKRSQKEWEESIAAHIGKFGDRITLDDLLAIAVGIWGAVHTQWPAHFLTGAIGYKLARTMGGTPPVSQIAGLSILGALGLVGLGEGYEFKLFPGTPAKGLQITGPYHVRVIG